MRSEYVLLLHDRRLGVSLACQEHMPNPTLSENATDYNAKLYVTKCRPFPSI